MNDLQTVREALELAFEETDSGIVANKCQKALEALSRLEAAAVPELSREDVVRKAREAGFDIFGLPLDILDRFVRFASLVRSVPRTLLEQYDLDQSPEYRKGREDGRALGYEVGYRFATERAATAVPVGEVKPVATFQGRRLTPEGTSEFWGSLLCDQSSDPPIGALFYTSPPTSESPCQFAIDNGGNLYRRYRDPVCAACVPAKKETDKWESARVADFNAGWNACRAAVLTTPPAPIEGWRMVPVEPTTEMRLAASDAPKQFDGHTDAEDIYRAMLSAAPQPGDK